VIYGLFASLLLANVVNLVLGSVGLRFFVLFLAVPRPLILSVAALLCVTGAYVSTGSMFGIGIVLAFGVLGYLLRKLELPFVVFLIGFVLGPIFERALRNTVNLFDDPWSLAAQHPLLPVLIALGCFAIWRSAVRARGPRTHGRLGGGLLAPPGACVRCTRRARPSVQCRSAPYSLCALPLFRDRQGRG
jgi:putative tricarboxylic transport membrane protein